MTDFRNALIGLIAIAVATVVADAREIAGVLTGTATAHDGDDLIINGTDFRLFGIDAFETGQPCWTATTRIDCGIEAKKELEAIVASKTVVCEPTGRDGKRLIAVCVADVLDVSEEMVRRGWALVRPDFAKDRKKALCVLEAEAKRLQKGVWAYSFELPYHYKGGKRKTRAQVSCGNAPVIVP